MQRPERTEIGDLIYELIEAGGISVLVGGAKSKIPRAVVAPLHQSEIVHLAVRRPAARARGSRVVFVHPRSWRGAHQAPLVLALQRLAPLIGQIGHISSTQFPGGARKRRDRQCPQLQYYDIEEEQYPKRAAEPGHGARARHDENASLSLKQKRRGKWALSMTRFRICYV